MPELAPNRRTVIVGGAVALGVAGCAGSPPATTPTAAPAAGTVLGPASGVPVGSATIFAAQGVVVTQAAAGTFAGFSTTCPHQGCAVAQVQGASIICPCHGSEFGLDGAVTQGPAQRGLTPKAVAVTGTEITLA